MILTAHSRLVRVAESAPAGQTDVTGDSVDMRTFHAVRFAALLGTVTAGGAVALKVQGSVDDVNWADLAGAEAATDGAGAEKVLAVDLSHPRFRFIRPVVTRTGENAQVDGVVADLYAADRLPVAQGDTVAATTFAHAAEAA